jgi:hypothetical protein
MLPFNIAASMSRCRGSKALCGEQRRSDEAVGAAEAPQGKVNDERDAFEVVKDKGLESGPQALGSDGQ